ncbi:MAG TPA: hypothetical protein PLR20_07755 [Syntrophales bacterium]|nr:hypothetical protein [Syntrophales bacterium]
MKHKGRTNFHHYRPYPHQVILFPATLKKTQFSMKAGENSKQMIEYKKGGSGDAGIHHQTY